MHLIDVQSLNFKFEAIADGGHFVRRGQVQVQQALTYNESLLFLFRFGPAFNRYVDVLQFLLRVICFNARERIQNVEQRIIYSDTTAREIMIFEVREWQLLQISQPGSQ